MHLKQLFTYGIRGAEGTFAVIVLGLSAGILAEAGINIDRVSYCLVVAILNLIYFGYIGGVLPFVTNNDAPSLAILICETLFALFYLAAMGSMADIVPGGSCDIWDGYNYYSSFSTGHRYNFKSICQLEKALIPFTLFNWLLFTSSLLLFLFYSYIPEVRTYGWGHIIKLTKYHLGAIWSDYTQPAFKKIVGADGGEKGVVAGEPAAEGTEDAVAPVVDEEARIGSSDEEARENKYAEATSEEGEDRPVQSRN
ncbi:hypothetical protein JA1_002252 [Spathaspora sp. JA1]|nr:hypothetical protein JA1_002252 [Spathaspora sp. JA1]